jgi:hypothetical protein
MKYTTNNDHQRNIHTAARVPNLSGLCAECFTRIDGRDVTGTLETTYRDGDIVATALLCPLCAYDRGHR